MADFDDLNLKILLILAILIQSKLSMKKVLQPLALIHVLTTWLSLTTGL